jgi:hypothetical protein
MGLLKEIVFEASVPAQLARFWAGLLDGYAVRDYSEKDIAMLSSVGLTPETDPVVMVDGPGPSLCFQKVDGRRYDNNRVHLDIAVADRNAAVGKARTRGASEVRAMATYTVMKDPEGNQFCLVDTGRAN